MIFYTSDHHFNHKNVIIYDGRPFSSIEEMNEALIKRYNSKVTDEDLVYFLGDIFFNDKAFAEAATRRMRGRKILVMGNHDRMSVTKFKSMGFEEVYKKQTLVRIDGRECLLTHFPQPFTPESVQLAFILHGHTHTRRKVSGRHIHVGVTAWDYYPVSEEEIVTLMKMQEQAELGST